MSKKLIFVLLIFFIIITSFAYINIFYLKSSSSEKFSIDFPTPAIAYTSLSLNAQAADLPSESIALVSVVINTNQSPKTIQLEIGYDPDVLFNPTLIPGNYFVNPEIVLENIDYKNGRISYALTCNGSDPCITHKANTVADISFNTIRHGFAQKTEITFLPKTSVKGENGVFKLDSLTGATINIAPSLFIPRASPSAAIIN